MSKQQSRNCRFLKLARERDKLLSFSASSSSRHATCNNADVSDNADNSPVPSSDVDAPISSRKCEKTVDLLCVMATSLVILGNNEIAE